MRLYKLLVFIIMLCSLIMLLSACGAQTQSMSLKPTPVTTPRPIPTKVTSPTPTLIPTVAAPDRLVIPRISVNAPVEKVGISASGDLATPKNNQWDGVGWYSNGPRPGEEGSAVINGHLDRPGGYPAVFWNLRYLRVGDTVLVVNIHGKVMHFRVLHVDAYAPQSAPVQEIFATKGGIYLNLITCAGTWIPSEHQTTQRLVVYTVME